MAGTLVPPWYEASTPTNEEQNIASMFWGFTLGVGLWSGVKGYRQSKANWKRTHRINTYVWLIWAEWMASIVIGIVSWCYLTALIGPSFEYFFLLQPDSPVPRRLTRKKQVQCLMQIIINRIAILMPIPAHATRLKWGVFAVLLAVNISVFCIWIPARLQISKTYIHINEIWDRIEKGIFLIVDAGLNLTFIYLVKSRLIASGLTKYTALFRFNLAMIAISMSLDIILIGLMSLPNTLIYAQFHPLAYLLKLHIEMGMAELIAKVVKASHPMSPHLESRRDSNEIAPDANQPQKSVSKSTGSRRFSSSYLGGRCVLGSTTADADGGVIEPQRSFGGRPEPRELEPESHANAVPGPAGQAEEALGRPRSLSRRATEPGNLESLEMAPQPRSGRQDSSSTVKDNDQEVTWYV
ncbi:hypothetical protein CH63R_03163 [Colletotrichum higginsianum IMI 349063]|uniref:Integral membrane protein n=2 Tax=Colletotrichum higginsianum (strain IMI 349063) TaxID=759273 RepID=A0A1B7YQX4_COLHI|nr:hypothetical protein CH63R_03163 [Colletotrichum higginsianum IMI 349063]OBR14437.1 hypothetical protein CH63R_03163 [Colletotrichum higginsianum IMI 349063]